MSRLNIDRDITFTLADLNLAGELAGHSGVVKDMVKALQEGPWTRSQVIEAGRRTGRSFEPVISKLYPARAAGRRKVTVSDGETLVTTNEIRQAIVDITEEFSQGRWVTAGSAQDFAYQITEKVLERRDPEFIVGRTYLTADGKYVRYREDGYWDQMGTSWAAANGVPKRPLKLVEAP